MSKTKTATTPKAKYPLIAFRLSEDMARKIATVSKEDKVSKSAVIKSAIEAYLKKRG
jgi:predicted DNA-binding protein